MPMKTPPPPPPMPGSTPVIKSPPPPPPAWEDEENTTTSTSRSPSPTVVPPPPPAWDDEEDDDHSTTSVPDPKTTTSSIKSRPNMEVQTNYIPSGKVGIVCPYCMREICIADMLYFCKRCKKTYTEKEAQTSGLGRTVKKQYYCCNYSITSNRICPNCGIIAEHNKVSLENIRLLPQEIYHAKNEFRVCMTGYSSSGKTQYMTQLMDYIVKYPIPGIDCTYFLDNETQKIREAIRNKFFIDGQIAGTPSGYLQPLLFDIRQRKRSYVSVFYDIAGEDFRENRDTLATRCIWNSKNILLVIDPTTLPGDTIQEHPRVVAFRSQLGKASTGEVAEPLNTYNNFVTKNQPNARKFLKNVNLAIVFPKMDLFYDDDDFPNILSRESSHIINNRYDANDVTAVSNAMKQWLAVNGGHNILQALNQYLNVQIFGVSSGSDDLSKKSKTNRLLDPYLWLLHQNDIL